VVDHPEGTSVGTSVSGNIYVYSEELAPASCVDGFSRDITEELSYKDDLSYLNTGTSYVTVTFPTTTWSTKAIAIWVGDGMARAKDPIFNITKANGHGGWDPIPGGTALTRKLPSLWLVNVTGEGNTFRIECVGDSGCLNSVTLVKIETSNVTVTEAQIAGATYWYLPEPGGGPGAPEYQSQGCLQELLTPGGYVTIRQGEQITASFMEVPADTTRQRDFVLQTVGYYTHAPIGGGGGGQGSGKSLRFDLDVQTLQGFRKPVLINYQVPAAAEVRIVVFDASGRLVAEPLNEEVKPGEHQLKWNLRDDAGRKVASGVYFVKMLAVGSTAGDFEETNKIVLTK